MHSQLIMVSYVVRHSKWVLLAIKQLKFAEYPILRNDIRKTGRQTQPYAAENYMQDRPPI